ncbi:hypothetical protein APR51_21140 [Variovorax paradoxus]|nr:hypothetical protein APR52_34565 [Variovorax paradoxus]KPV19225.1 hypothetical protein APR51_21140 [Variovorax paradoxus]
MFMTVSSLRIQATMMTLGSLPAAFTLSEGGNRRVVLHGGMSSHAQHPAHVAAAAPDTTASAVLAAIACQRRHAHELGDLATIELSDLRTQREHCSAEHRAYAWAALQQVVLGAPDRQIAKETAHVIVELCNTSLQPGQVLGQALAHGLGRRRVLTLHFLNAHVHKLATSAQQIGQLAGLLILWRFGLWADELGKSAKRPRIDGVCLGQLSAGARKASRLARIDYRHHQRTRREFARQTLLEST